MKEIWKDIKGYEGLYQISNLGNVKSLERYKQNHGVTQLVGEKIKSTRLLSSGYLVTDLYKDNKSKTAKIHRLVAETFIPNPNSKETVNHIDGNKLNNRVDNLEWATHREQNDHFYKIGLKSKESINKAIQSMIKSTSKQVQCLTTNKIYNSINEASKDVNISSSIISRCCKGKCKSAGKNINGEPLRWVYL